MDLLVVNVKNAMIHVKVVPILLVNVLKDTMKALLQVLHAYLVMQEVQNQDVLIKTLAQDV
jgi:hypothetical protein